MNDKKTSFSLGRRELFHTLYEKIVRRQEGIAIELETRDTSVVKYSLCMWYHKYTRNTQLVI